LRQRGLDAQSLREWQGGRFRSRPDREILSAADLEARVLVTYDVRSIPSLIRSLAPSGFEHSGIIYVSSNTIKANQIGALADAIERYLVGHGDLDWRNLEMFLAKAD
jgi:hypothetical protein